jgi:hypothetical protein
MQTVRSGFLISGVINSLRLGNNTEAFASDG